MAEGNAEGSWTEADSEYFIDVGRYFVPDREVQIDTICDLIPDVIEGAHVVELCCGEGLLSRALLERLPGATVHAFDGSAAMLAKASTALASFGGRFDPRPFDIFDAGWRKFPWRPHAVVSSLAIHHLDGPQKRQLYEDVARALAPGGVFVIADLVEPTTPEGRGVAAKAWDDAVRAQALALDGDLAAFERFLADNWNYYSDPDPDPVDKPSPLYAQLGWLEAAGLKDADVHWLKAGHAIFSARKRKI